MHVHTHTHTHTHTQYVYRAFVHNDSGDTGWTGLRSSVRARYEGPNALRWEVAWFVGRMYVMPVCQQLLAAICLFSSLGTSSQKYSNEGRCIAKSKQQNVLGKRY
jgi:hypothetical protein